MRERSVLVVDDHAPTREAYAAFLSECGYRVLQASHGGEAILLIHRHRPDVVLMDVAMPVLDGVETVESLRGCAPTADIRIVAVTGSASRAEQERMLALCDDLVVKPCPPDLIATKIQSVVEVAA